jgi:hypothetical protein
VSEGVDEDGIRSPDELDVGDSCRPAPPPPLARVYVRQRRAARAPRTAPARPCAVRKVGAAPGVAHTSLTSPRPIQPRQTAWPPPRDALGWGLGGDCSVARQVPPRMFARMQFVDGTTSIGARKPSWLRL